MPGIMWKVKSDDDDADDNDNDDDNQRLDEFQIKAQPKIQNVKNLIAGI